jgi:hypothetical protein
MSDEIRWQPEWDGLPRQHLLRVLRQELTVEEMAAALEPLVPAWVKKGSLPARAAGSDKQLTLAERCREAVATMVRPVLAECLLRGEVRRSSRDGKTTYVACVDAGEVTEVGEGFPYSELPEESRTKVRRLAQEIKELANRSAQGIVEIGRHLLNAKKHLAHGLFGRWLQAEFRWTDRQAQRVMNVAECFGKNDKLSVFGPSALYLLAAPSTPEAARQEAQDAAAEGEQVTHARAREIVSRHRPGGGPRKGKAPAAAGDAGPRQEQVRGAAALDVVEGPAAPTTALAEQEMGVAAVAEEEPAVQDQPDGQAEAVAQTTRQHGSARLILEALAMQLECYAADARRAVLLPEHEHGRELGELLDRISATQERARAGEPL